MQGNRSKFVRKSADETLTASHLVQRVKQPVNKCFGAVFLMGTGKLIPIEGMMNSEKYKALLEKYCVAELAKVDAIGKPVF